MLRAISEHSAKGLPFLGINFGHKGFLLNDPRWIFPEIGAFESRDYSLLDISKNGKTLGKAFNDIHLYSPE
jgi:NAD kinase